METAKTIEQIKDEVAQTYAHLNHEPFKDWPDLLLTCITEKRLKQIDEATTKAMQIYASQFQTKIPSNLPNEDAIKLMAKEWASCFEPPERLGMESANLAGLLRMAWIASDVIKQKEKELTGLFPKGFYDLADLPTKIKMLLACREAFLNQPNEAMSFAEWASSNEWAFIENEWVELAQPDSETLRLTTYQLYQLYQSEKAKP